MEYVNPKSEHPDLFGELAKAIPHLPGADKVFAMSLHDYYVKHKGWSEKQAMWAKKMVEKVGTVLSSAPIPSGQYAIGGSVPPIKKVSSPLLVGIPNLLKQATTHLKHPSIVVHVPPVVVPFGSPLPPEQVKVFKDPHGPDYKVGSTKGFFKCYGYLKASGEWVPRTKYPSVAEAIGNALLAFSYSPAKSAGAYGHKHGKCCFCQKGLTDPTSKAVGYGPVCAKHYNLPWGGVTPKGLIPSHYKKHEVGANPVQGPPVPVLKPLAQAKHEGQALAAEMMASLVSESENQKAWDRLRGKVEYLF